MNEKVERDLSILSENKKMGAYFFVRSWLGFFFRPLFIQMKDPTYIGWSEEANAKLPGLPTLLWVYEKRCVGAGMIVTYGGLTVMAYLSWVWPFLVGLAINAVFIVILLRYRSRFYTQYPIIAREFTKYVKWLVFFEAGTILAFFYWIFGMRQAVHF
ncbi:MAG TPA: hypothetical protein VNG51_09145 [Ktedonobacteraceae bacterium]|nr:hypothetical protein [Ktedonobacteraceae bacterium]